MNTANQTATRLTLLDANPFRLLGVTTCDSRRRVLEQAEEQALHIDPSLCQKARSDLTNPRARLAAELAWLPGVPPDRVESLIESLHGDPLGTLQQPQLPELARVNLMSAALEIVDPQQASPSVMADFMQGFGEAIARLEREQILRDVNQHRAIAGFPEVRDAAAVDEELAALSKRYKATLTGALDAMPSVKLLETMTLLVQRSTQQGTRPAPAIIDELVDRYVIETQEFLDCEEKTISALVEGVRAAAASGEDAVKPLVDKLEQVARNWDKVANPIQLSMQVRGMAHRKSRALGYELRSLAIDLYNEHGLAVQAGRMTALLRELFAEVGDLAERLGEDATALDEIARRKAHLALLGPLRASCKEAAEAARFAPRTADGIALALAGSAEERIAQAVRAGVPVQLAAEVADEVAQVVLHCAAAFANETQAWSRCVELLSAVRPLAVDPKTQERLAQALGVVERNAVLSGASAPIESAPSLFTFNGCGFALYGNTDHDAASNSHMATYYFVLAFIPILPISRYRVVSTGTNSYRFLAKGPLRTFDKVHLALSLGFILSMLLR
jgi:hypothetical protein